MRISRFTDLPPEVILRIFRHADSFATVNALVRTASIFHCVWLMNANTIALRVLPEAIECYNEAHDLVEAQELAKASKRLSGGRRRSHREVVIVLVQRYLANHRLITGFYESNIVPVLKNLDSDQRSKTSLDQLERGRFLKTLYHLKTLAVSYEYNEMGSSTLSGIGEAELIDLAEAASWLRRKTHVERRVRLGVEDLLTDRGWLQRRLDSRLATLQLVR